MAAQNAATSASGSTLMSPANGETSTCADDPSIGRFDQRTAEASFR
jgi:hypothetical protein